MYRKKMASLIQSVKSATAKGDLSEILRDYKPKPPKKENNLAELVKTVQSEILNTNEQQHTFVSKLSNTGNTNEHEHPCIFIPEFQVDLVEFRF